MDHRVFLLVISFILTTAAAPQTSNTIPAPQSKDAGVKILKQINKVNSDGSYTYGYEADDGSFKVETRDTQGVVKGKYGFVDVNGQLKTIEYTAGQKAPGGEEEEDTDQSFAAQTPSAKTVKTVVTSKAKGPEDDGSNGDEDDGRYAQDGFNNDDLGSYGQPQQRNPQYFTQGGQGQIQGSPFLGGSGGNDDGGFSPSPFAGGPQYVPTGQFQRGQGGSPFGFQGQSSPQFQGQFQGQPQVFTSGGQRQLGGFQGTQQFGGPQPGFSQGGQFNGLSGGPGQFSGGPGQFNGGPTSTGFPIVSGGQGQGQFGNPQALTVQGQDGQQYVANPELDGFSDDQDQDGFVDAFPGSGQQLQGQLQGQPQLQAQQPLLQATPLGAARSAQAEGAEKATAAVKAPAAAGRLASPQVTRIQNNPSLQGQGGPGSIQAIQGGQGGAGPVFFNGPQPQSINGQLFGQPQQGQLSDAQIQALLQQQGFDPSQVQGGGRPGIPQSPFGGQQGQQQFSQFNPAQFQNGPQQFSQFNPQGGFQGGQPQFSPQGFQVQPQQFSTGGGQQFSPQSQGINQQGGLVQIQGGQFSPSSPSGTSGGSGFGGSGPTQFSGQGGVPFGAVQQGGQQFAPVQNFLPQGGQGGIPPQFLQQQGQGGQTFSTQQGQPGSIQSPGFPFDYNPYAGPYQGGFPGQGQFASGPFGGVGGGVVNTQPGAQGLASPQGISGQGATYLLGGGQQTRGVISSGSSSSPASSSPAAAGGSTSESVSKSSSDDKKSA